MEEKGLYIINDKTETWIGDVKRNPTNLDLFFASEEISDDMKYRQEEDIWGSDHFPVIVSMKFMNKSYKKRSNRISNYKTDWNKYKKNISNRNNELEKEKFIGSSVEMRYNYINKIMREEVYKASGNKKDIEEIEKHNKEEGDSIINNKNKGKRRNNNQKRNRKGFPVEWWDEECKIAIEKRKKALKEFKRKRKL